MKKKFMLLLALSTMLLVVAACNNNAADDNTNTGNDSTTNQNNTENNATGDTTGDMATDRDSTDTANLPFTSFELDVDYGNNKSFEVDYDNERADREAKIDDELNNQVLSGEEAFQELNNRFQTFTFDQNSANDDVINEVIKSFELDENYTKFDLDIRFADGIEKEYVKTK